MGKIELEKLLADVAMLESDKLDIKAFHDRFRAAGSIPISLIRWEMTDGGRVFAARLADLPKGRGRMRKFRQVLSG